MFTFFVCVRYGFFVNDAYEVVKEIIYNNEDGLNKQFKNQGYDVIDITNDIVVGEYPEFSLKLINNSKNILKYKNRE